MLKKGKYTKKELETISHALNDLIKQNCSDKISICVNAYKNFHNNTHYIDFHERLSCYKVYVKFKGWRE